MSVHTTMARAGTAVRNALSYAHLSGIGASKAEDEEDKKKKDARAEDDKEKDKDARADDDKDDKKEAAEGDDKDDKKDAAEDDDGKKKDASNDDDKKDASEDDDDKKKEASEDDDEEEMRGKGALAKARRRERARCAAIFSDKAAGRNPQLAAQLAFNTALSRTEALAVLRGTPAPASANAAARAAGNPRIGPGGQVAVTEAHAIQSRWDSAMAKVGAASRRKV